MSFNSPERADTALLTLILLPSQMDSESLPLWHDGYPQAAPPSRCGEHTQEVEGCSGKVLYQTQQIVVLLQLHDLTFKKKRKNKSNFQ